MSPRKNTRSGKVEMSDGIKVALVITIIANLIITVANIMRMK